MAVLERLTSIAYPLGDVALLAIAVRLAVGSGSATARVLAAGRQHRRRCWSPTRCTAT